jgi:hypothetical protein
MRALKIVFTVSITTPCYRSDTSNIPVFLTLFFCSDTIGTICNTSNLMGNCKYICNKMYDHAEITLWGLTLYQIP